MRATKNTLELLRLQHRLEQHRLEEDVAAMATAVFAVYYDIVDCKHGFLDRAQAPKCISNSSSTASGRSKD